MVRLLQLPEKASYLTTFSTVYGKYHGKRYPFGLISAQDEFQQRMEHSFESLQGLCIAVDYLLIYGRTQKENDGRLEEVLK
ncbi:hypothetical protein QYM36_002407 [Artemia franciscana]|uniref:Uncharacterized protein n=1 Tax=Artemia franciscana TaxID=6661 RepID=A0AA88LB90_ARTSF|nr:hypothetical protein QYM36_002407 [Artemia franciscana]